MKKPLLASLFFLFTLLAVNAQNIYYLPESTAKEDGLDWYSDSNLHKINMALFNIYDILSNKTDKRALNKKLESIAATNGFISDGNSIQCMIYKRSSSSIADFKDDILRNPDILILDSTYSLGFQEALIPIFSLPIIAQGNSIQYITPSLCPILDAGPINSEGIEVLHADDLHDSGFNGQGVKIGVISDGVGTGTWLTKLTSLATSGEIPPISSIEPIIPIAVNTDAIQELNNAAKAIIDEDGAQMVVIDNKRSPNTAEGLAMCEIIHDIAPGADIVFCSDKYGIPKAIERLDAVGCDIIVDDISNLNLPWFQLDTKPHESFHEVINNFTTDGGIYLSASGNYQSRTTEKLHNFGNNNSFTIGIPDKDTINVPKGDSITIYLQWKNPWGKRSDSLRIVLLDRDNITDTLARSSLDSNPNPEGTTAWKNTTGSSKKILISIDEVGVQREVLFRLVVFGGWNIPSKKPASVFSHTGYQNVLSIGTSNHNHLDTITDYSSHGPYQVYSYSDDLGWSDPIEIFVPDFTSVDGVLISGAFGFGNEIPNVTDSRRFFGTSAAAPHAAATIALLMSSQPNLNNVEILSLLKKGAVKFNSGINPGKFNYDPATGRSNETGYGRLDALELFHTLPIHFNQKIVVGRAEDPTNFDVYFEIPDVQNSDIPDTVTNLTIDDKAVGDAPFPVTHVSGTDLYHISVDADSIPEGFVNNQLYDIEFQAGDYTFTGENQVLFIDDFVDVDDTNYAYKYISTCTYYGLFKGHREANGDRKFNPDQNIKRGEAAKVICDIAVRAGKLEYNNSTANGTFVDIPPDHDYFPFVQTLKNNNIVRGCDDPNDPNDPEIFCPEDYVTYEQFAKMLVKALELLDANNQTKSEYNRYYDHNGNLIPKAVSTKYKYPKTTAELEDYFTVPDDNIGSYTDPTLYPYMLALANYLVYTDNNNALNIPQDEPRNLEPIFEHINFQDLDPKKQGKIHGPALIKRKDIAIILSKAFELVTDTNQEPPSAAPMVSNTPQAFGLTTTNDPQVGTLEATTIIGQKLRLPDYVSSGATPSIQYLNIVMYDTDDPKEWDGATHDSQGNKLTYFWTINGGTLEQFKGENDFTAVRFTPPTVTEPTDFTLYVWIGNTKGHAASAYITITVLPDGTPPPVDSYEFIEAQTCTGIVNGQYPSGITPDFTAGENVHAWCAVGEITEPIKWHFKWYKPDQSLAFTDQSDNWFLPNDNGDHPQWSILNVTDPGTWHVEFYVEVQGGNTYLEETKYFQVVSDGCSAPTGLDESSITPTTSWVSWEEVPNVNSYTLYWGRTSNSTQWNVVIPSSFTSKYLTNLSPNTGYWWYVKATCDNGTYQSAQRTFNTADPNYLDINGNLKIDINSSPNSVYAFEEYELNIKSCWQYGDNTNINIINPVYKVYLSTSNSISDAIAVLYTSGQALSPISSINGGTSCKTRIKTNHMGEVPAGTYRIIAVIDYDDKYQESNENDNIDITTVAVLPTEIDITVLNEDNPMITAQPGETITITNGQHFVGNTNLTYESSLGFYWGSNPTLAPTDPSIGVLEMYLSAQNPNASGSITYVIPQGTPSGLYYIILKADRWNERTETDEGNNYAYIPIDVVGISASCELPTQVATSNITYSSAEASWNPVSDAIQYNFQWKEVGASEWITEVVLSSYFSLEGLTAEVNYEWRVQTRCSDGINPNWTDVQNFETLTCMDEFEPNNTIQTASTNAFATLGEYNYSHSINATINIANDQDFYKIQHLTSGQVSIQLTNLSTDEIISLYDEQGNFMGSSTPVQGNESIAAYLDDFSYFYIKVSSPGGEYNCASHTLSITWTPTNTTPSFITTWLTTSPNESITIPTIGGGYDYTVDWGDGTVTNGHSGDASHAYASTGHHLVSITGQFPRIYFANSGDKDKIISIDQWGANEWSSMRRAFMGCLNLSGQAIDTPNLTSVTDMSYMFSHTDNFNQNIGNWDVSHVNNLNHLFWRAYAFNQNLNSWDVSNVTSMYGTFFVATSFNQPLAGWNVGNVSSMGYMFNMATSFNQPIGSWNVSNVHNLNQMFANATAFNQNIGMWNTSNVTNMQGVFSNAINFNQDIGSWDVSNVTTMWKMFQKAYAFNQNIGTWNVANVIDMRSMFSEAESFNQDIGSWNVANVLNMGTMFSQATSFNKNIGSWNVGKVEDMSFMFSWASNFDQNIGAWNIEQVSMDYMFVGAGLSIANYDALLIGWSARNLLNGVPFSGGSSKYCQGTNARAKLISDFGWTISDGGPGSGNQQQVYEDLDGDGFGNPDESVVGCASSGYVINDFDCDDSNPFVGLPPVIEQNSTVICPGEQITLSVDSNQRHSLAIQNNDNYVRVPNSPSLQITGDLTIEMWLKPSNFDLRRNPLNKTYGGEYTITQETSGRLTFFCGTSGNNAQPYHGFLSQNPIIQDEWNQIVVVKDISTSSVRWYINGVLDKEEVSSFAQTTTASTSDILIGEGYTNGYAGNIDEIRIWNTVLTESEIQSWMNKTITSAHPKYTNLQGYWRFDEGTGTTAHDLSDNGNDGTFVNTPAWSIESPILSNGDYVWSNGETGNSITVTPTTITTYTVGYQDGSCTDQITITPDAGFNVTETIVDATCQGDTDGSIQLDVLGNANNMSFIWDNGSTGSTIESLPAGIYFVTVTEANGCSQVLDYQIVEQSVLTSEFVTTNVSGCGKKDGALTAVPQGGVAPYSYAWSSSLYDSEPTISGLQFGVYKVTVTDANGCTLASDWQHIDGPNLSNLNVQISSVPNTCTQDNGSALAFVSGGQPPYSYVWQKEGQSILASYNFSHSTDFKVDDYSVHNHVGTLHANATSTEYLEIGHNNADYFEIPAAAFEGLTDFQLSMDFNLTQVNSWLNSLISVASQSDNNEFLVYYSSAGKISIHLTGQFFQFVVPSNITVDAWHNIVIERKNMVLSVILDGVQIGTANSNGNPINADYALLGQDQDVVAGNFDTSQSLWGKIDNFELSTLTYDAGSTIDNLGTGLVTVFVKDAQGCQTTMSTYIESVSAEIEQANSSVCYDEPLTLNAEPQFFTQAEIDNGNQSTIVTYGFENVNSTSIPDDSKHGNNGILHGNASAASFLETGLNNLDYMELPSSIFEGLEDFEMSFDFSLNQINSSANTFISISSLNTDNEFILFYTLSKRLHVYLKGYSYPIGEQINLQTNTWYQVNFKRKDGRIYLYLDGNLIGDKACVIGSISAEYVVLGQEQDNIGGGFATNQSLAGKIDNFVLKSINLAKRTNNKSKAALVSEMTIDYTVPQDISIPTESGKEYLIEASGIYTVWQGCDYLNRRENYFDPAFHFNHQTTTPKSLFTGAFESARPQNDHPNDLHGYSYVIQGNGSPIQLHFSDNEFNNDCQCYTDNCGFINFKVWELQPIDFNWSNGDNGLSSTQSFQQSQQVILTAGTAPNLCKDTVNIDVTCGFPFGLKSILQGPYKSSLGLMDDKLREANLIPLIEPYTNLPNFTHSGGGGGETTTQEVLDVSGVDAIVDWVFIEFKDPSDPSVILATKSALLQRDGDIVDVDGIHAIKIPATVNGSAYISIRHRNHLGIMTDTPIQLTNFANLDFTQPSISLWGENAQKNINGTLVMYGGNANGDPFVKYNGAANDRVKVLVKVGFATPNNVVPGYHSEDVNMDGLVKYNGSSNDRVFMLINVGFSTPNNVIVEQKP